MNFKIFIKKVWLKALLKGINYGEWKLTGMVSLSELKFSITKTVIGFDLKIS
jgi:hypothetical protein